MHGSLPFLAETDEIFFRISALPAPTLNVMDLKPGNRPTVLTSPAVSLQDFPAQPAVGIGTQPNVRTVLRVIGYLLEEFLPQRCGQQPEKPHHGQQHPPDVPQPRNPNRSSPGSTRATCPIRA